MKTTTTTHSKNIIKCDLCQKQYTKASSLKHHIINNHVKKIVSFKCEHCPIKFSSTSLLAEHNKRIHENVACSICKKIFSGNSTLKKHIDRTHGAADKANCESFPCDVCTYVTKRKSHLKRHKDSKHGRQNIILSCDTCIKTFTSKDQLRRHKNKHEGLLLKCDFCKFETPRTDSLKIHKQRKHTTEMSKTMVFESREENA